MKTKLSFLKHIKFTGSLAIIFFFVSLFLVYSHSFSKGNNIYTSSRVTKVEFIVLDDSISKEEALDQKETLEYLDSADAGSAGPGKLDFVDPKNIIVRATVAPVDEEGTFFLLNSNKNTKEYVNVYSDDKELVSTYPQVVSYNPKGEFGYYLLKKSDEPTNVYVYFDKQYGANGFSKPSFLVGTESELLLIEGYRSVADFIIAGILLILAVFIYIVFYVTSIEKYHVVRIFAVAFFLISLQCIIFSPFVTFAFNEFERFFLIMKCATYFFICALTFLIPCIYSKHKKIRIAYVANVLLCLIGAVVSGFLIMNSNPSVAKIVAIFNVYYMLISIYSLVINLYNFADETDELSILRIISFSAMVTLNLFFYYYETESSVNTFRNPYYFILTIFIIFVVVYISSIFYYRGKSMRDTKLFLYDEKETIDRLYSSNKNAITTTNIEEISENILRDLKGIYQNFKFCMILYRDLNKNLEITAHTEFSGDIERHAKKVFSKYYKSTKKSSFSTNFNSDTAVLTFRSTTGEILLVYIKNDKALTELDQTASEILASPILLSFNNCRIYDEISNTERELLYAIGNLTHVKSGGKSDIWRSGEFAYLLAKNTGLSEQTAKNLRVASYIQDIGKIGMSDEYVNLNKMSQMNEALFYQHTKIGYDMLSKFGGETMKLASICSLYHHEKFNGKGYLGKMAEETPIEARIVIIATAFDAFYEKLIEDNEEMTLDVALEDCYNYLSMNKQTIFDPLLVQLFIKDKAGILKIIRESNLRAKKIPTS